MKQPKLNDLKVDITATKNMRSQVANAKKIKITINIDETSLSKLKENARNTGIPYQRLINQILQRALHNLDSTESRLIKLEKELSKLKKKIAA